MASVTEDPTSETLGSISGDIHDLTDLGVSAAGRQEALTDPALAGMPAELAEELAAISEEATGESHDGRLLRQAQRQAAAQDPVPAQAAVPMAPAAPAPVPIPRRLRRGRYRSTGTGFQLELRVDIDGSRPTRRVSGDFFSTSGATTSYFGSFIVHSPTITTTAAAVVVRGLGTYTWAAGAPVVQVTIPHRTILQPPANATVQFFTTSNSPGASYLCLFASAYFRTVQWEQDSVAGSVPFVSYNTGSLPQPPGSPTRVLTVPRAFAEAGVEVQVAGAPNTIPTSVAGADLKWTDAELHNAMRNHFSLFRDSPQWKVWLVVATSHVGGYRGIMFDYSDSFQRQGCAVFYDAIKGLDAENQRAQLRTYVHELGHAFNLLHSWQKDLASPPQPLGLNHGFGDLSWMNYPQNYNRGDGSPAGTTAYWAAFPFQFTANELIHLRHGYYRNVIMGANAFLVGAGDIDAGLFEDPVVDDSGLRLELRSKDVYEFGEPVVVELKLSTTDLRGRMTHGYLHPNDDFTAIAIRQPSGRTVLFRPMQRHCADAGNTIRLDVDRPALYSSAYIGYGRDGHYFEQPGTYKIRASYVASDGSRVMSPVQRIRVRHPLTRTDEEVAELMMGPEQGALFALLGSDSPHLKAGNDALSELIDRHARHPFAVFARLVKGVNAERDFKNLSADPSGSKVLTVRAADTKESIHQLNAVVDASTSGGKGVDNITLNMVMRRLAHAQARQGDLERANAVLDRMVEMFSQRRLSPRVLATIKDRAETAKAALAAEAGGERR